MYLNIVNNLSFENKRNRNINLKKQFVQYYNLLLRKLIFCNFDVNKYL